MSEGKEDQACFLWQHEHGSKWITYSADKLEAINKAVNKSQKSVTLPDASPTKQIVVNFEDMIQKNKTTGWEQRIRCCVFDGSGFYVWQWKDDGYWYSYGPKVALELENSLSHGVEKLNLYFNGADYEINLKDMVQRNEETNTARGIKRSKVAVSKAEKSLLHVVVVSKAALLNELTVKNAEDGDTGVSKKRKTASSDKNECEPCFKTLVFKGKVPVDSECTEKLGCAHVYSNCGDVYDAKLNQTNLQYNNNKFYIIQLLEDDRGKSYSVWYRWGRVGKRGQSNLVKFGTNLDSAIQEFTQKFYDKTRNNWHERKEFEKVEGKYDLLKMDYNADETKVKKLPKPKKEPSEKPKSNLHPKVMSLIELICDIKLMEDAVMEMKFDAKKAPLGKLTVEQIKAGYVALKKIEDVLKNNYKGSVLIQACNEFYTRIPHDFGMKSPPLIQTTTQIKEKMQMLEALGDIQIAVKMLNDELGKNEHPADNHYKSLNCHLTALDRGNPTFKMIEKYLKNTHAQTHSNYSIEIVDIFECVKQGEKEKFKDVGNRMLLWHGSRLTNWVGILKQGLRIAPQEAPSTGYMFGKGLYFADMSSKSANYCYATRTKNEGLISLCEVSIGESNKLIDADYDGHKLPKGKHSVMGLGRVAPNPKEIFVMDDGTKVPVGKPIDTGLQSDSYTLNYNEYVVYNVNQVKIRYIVRAKFIFV